MLTDRSVIRRANEIRAVRDLQNVRDMGQGDLDTRPGAGDVRVLNELRFEETELGR